MSLVGTIERVKSGVFNLVCLRDGTFDKLGSGSAFYSSGYLITNFHVANIRADSWMWIRREGDLDHRFSGFVMRGADWLAAIRRASEEHSYDYAVLDLPQLKGSQDIHSFELGFSDPLKIGRDVAFLGFPLDHVNLTCHAGMVSSIHKSGVARMIQIDASVNASNSGGPLIDPVTGRVLGIVSRKATGLSLVLEELKKSIDSNVKSLEQSQGKVFLGGLDPIRSAIVSQLQLKATLGEIERQANVGIGYAIDICHVLEEVDLWSV